MNLNSFIIAQLTLLIRIYQLLKQYGQKSELTKMAIIWNVWNLQIVGRTNAHRIFCNLLPKKRQWLMECYYPLGWKYVFLRCTILKEKMYLGWIYRYQIIGTSFPCGIKLSIWCFKIDNVRNISITCCYMIQIKEQLQVIRHNKYGVCTND